MKHSKTLCLSLAVAMILAVSAACANQITSDDSNSGTSSEGNSSAQTTVAVDPLEEMRPVYPANLDFGEYEFKILTRGDEAHAMPLHTRDLFAEAITADPINDAVYRRNLEVEDKFNIKIKAIVLPEGNENAPNEALKKSVLAEEDEYDLLMTHAGNGATTASAGYLLSWNTIPYIDPSKPWWCEGAVKGLAVGDKLFLSLSDLSVSSNHYAYMVYFNKSVHREFNVVDLYDLVRSGKWTFDKIAEVTKGITQDISGDGVMDEKDRYGAIVSYGALNFLYAGGNTIMSKDEKNYPFLNVFTERAISTFEKAYDICHADYTMFAPGWQNFMEMNAMFASDKVLLYMTNLERIDALREMDSDFGVLPYPKLDENQDKYYTYVDSHSPLMGIPRTASDTERTGAIVEELSYLSRKYLVPAYYDVTLKTKFARDDESSEMFDYIFDGRVYDFGYVYDLTTTFIFQNQINDKKREYMSALEKRMTTAEKLLEKIIAAYDDVA
ncbi:hypothetical protein FACS1894105_01700 [Clostridia bacterium]|nr:hypothetical protein FACS1894105_01700 [Clostridia bacterium]